MIQKPFKNGSKSETKSKVHSLLKSQASSTEKVLLKEKGVVEKKSDKPKSRNRKKDFDIEEEEPIDLDQPTPFLREFLGLVLVCIAVVILIGLVSHFASGEELNILGPFLGKWMAHQMIWAMGRLPSFLFLGLLIYTGVSLIRWKSGFPWNGFFTSTMIYVLSLLLLSIKHIQIAEFTWDLFENSGGYLGNFLVQTLYIPVFGTTYFGPYLVTLLTIALTIIWGFKLGISTIMEKIGEFFGILVYPLVDGWEKVYGKADSPNTLNSLVTADSLDAEDLLVEEENSTSTDTKKISSRVKANSKSKKDLPTRLQDITPVDLPDDEEITDPLVIRKLRDQQAEIRRVQELNSWESQARDPKIAGVLSKKEEQRAESEWKESHPAHRSNVNAHRNTSDESVEETNFDRDLEPDALEEEFEEVAQLRSKPRDLDGVGYSQIPAQVKDNFDEYKIPDYEKVLTEPPIQKVEYTEQDLKSQARVLEEQLANFKVMGKVVGICTGPVIIRYEIELAPGVKVSQISGLSDDLALALRAKSIRILTPIPGKSLVGIEVPNRNPQIVYLKSVLKAPSFKPDPDSIKLVLGQDISGEPMVMDLTKAPHLLIAGQTGSGKSVGVNTFMASILFSKSPDEVRLILVDPKVVELKPYENIPHLLAPVVTQPEVAVQALKWSTFEMDRRYEVLAKAGVRNIKGYNQKFRTGKLPESIPEDDRRVMPRIVIVIDELADLMMVAGKEVETSIARIAQKARAVGIHLILATQRPSTNVITGTIKANLPTRIAFQVASQIDARTIMDKAGSEKLLGRGDMLFRSIDSPEPERIHGSFVDDEQAEAIALACSEQNVCFPQIPSFEVDSAEGEFDPGAESPKDHKFVEAAELVVSIKQASVSLLQRRMAIGYARSGRIVDQLEKAGIVGKDRGSKPREVLMDEVELRQFLETHNYI